MVKLIRKNNLFLTQILPGILLAFLISLPAWIIGNIFPVIGSPILAILFGITASNFIPEKYKFRKGLSFTGTNIFQLGIVLLGFSINIKDVVHYGNLSIKVSIITVISTFLLAYLLQKKFQISSNSSVLLSIGNAISGPSAIGAASPVIKAKNEETVNALTIVFFFNTIAAIIFPHIALYLHMSNVGFMVFIGTTISDMSSITAASISWEGATGDSVIAGATVTKLVRTLMIVPVVMSLFIYKIRKERYEEVNENKEKNNEGRIRENPKHEFLKTFPYFILLFILASIITTYMNFPTDVGVYSKIASKALIVIAMGAIGLNSSLKKLVSAGFKPLLYGFILWITNTVFCIVLQYLFNII